MIQSYYAQRKHQITFILGSTLIPKVKGVCDGDLINLWNNFQHTPSPRPQLVFVHFVTPVSSY